MMMKFECILCEDDTNNVYSRNEMVDHFLQKHMTNISAEKLAPILVDEIRCLLAFMRGVEDSSQ